LSKAAKKQEKGKQPGKEKAAGKERAEALAMEDPARIAERLRPLKALTVYSVAQALGIKGSAANSLLRRLVESGVAIKVGGYSGHYVYALKEGSSTQS